MNGFSDSSKVSLSTSNHLGRVIDQKDTNPVMARGHELESHKFYLQCQQNIGDKPRDVKQGSLKKVGHLSRLQ